MKKGATLSKNRKLRYRLWRIWDKSKGLVLFIGINPSTADATEDDPTIRRLIAFCEAWGFGGFYIGNIYPWRSSKPGPAIKNWGRGLHQNQRIVRGMVQRCDQVVVMWGRTIKENNHIALMLKKLLPKHVSCFGTNSNGTPKHPLFLKGDTKLIKYY